MFDTSGIKSIPEGEAAKDVLFAKRLVVYRMTLSSIGGGTIAVNKTKIEFGDPIHPIDYRNIQSGVFPREVQSYHVPPGEISFWR